MILQMLPDATEEDILICEHLLQGLKPMSTLMLDYDDMELKDLVNDMFEDAKILDTSDVRYSCPCSKERMANAISTLKDEEIQDMIDKDHGCHVTCNFCNERYDFSEEDLRKILESRNV